MEKLQIFTSTIITLNYSTHPLFETFLQEWEYKINKQRVEELVLFNDKHDKIIIHKFNEEEQIKYYKYFEDINLFYPIRF